MMHCSEVILTKDLSSFKIKQLIIYKVQSLIAEPNSLSFDQPTSVIFAGIGSIYFRFVEYSPL